MSVQLLILTALVGGVGSTLRYLVDITVRAKAGATYPWGTTVVNISGSFALGVVTGAATAHLTEPWVTVVGTGLLGGYTTFSTASVDTVRLLLERRPVAGLVNGLGSILVCVAVAYLGLAAGRLG